MQLTRYKKENEDLFGGLSQLQEELNRIFDFSEPRWLSHPRGFGLLERLWSPAVDVFEGKDDIRVKVELPGMKKDGIDLTIQGDTLIIKGERKEEKEEKKNNYHRTERVYGQFHRSINLPSSVKSEGVKASYKDGILEVTLPKKDEVKPKQIEVDLK